MGGSGGSFRWPSRDELRKATQDAESAATSAAFGAQLATSLSQLLATYNDRDRGLIASRLEQVRELLEGEIEGAIDTLYGGSVAKHTYVDGLSDVDALLLLNETKLRSRKPASVKSLLANILGEHLSKVATVEEGRMAITMTYGDGMVIQCLPALRTKDGGLKIASSRGKNVWAEIDPAAFQAALTRRNQECGNQLVPTIKLAKAINASLPQSVQLSGYHLESLAIAAFRGYAGERTAGKMLPFLFEKASDLVLRPITDRSGQSLHVDEYLGPAKSPPRIRASQVLSRIYRRMRNATASENLDEWHEFFN